MNEHCLFARSAVC